MRTAPPPEDPLLQLSPTHSQPSADALHRPGAFLWWYLDLIDERGDGLVLIFSWGLPFLPGLAAAARDGQATPPAARPSVCFSLYEGGKTTFYLLQELDPDAAHCDVSGRLRIGSSTLETTLEPDGGLLVEASLDCPIPGSVERLVGRVVARGRPRMGGDDSAPYPSHTWSPRLAAADATARLLIGGRRSVELKGRGYHDRNDGTAPLHAHGIREWWWARLALPDRELVWYALAAEAPAGATASGDRQILMEIGRDGAARRLDSPEDRHPGALGPAADLHLFGPRSPRRLRLHDSEGAPVEARLRCIDDSPFYQRFTLEGRSAQGPVRGFAERVRPAAIDPDWMRPLVRMRVHAVGRKSSRWLPLFNGPVETRLSRLLQHMLRPSLQLAAVPG